MDPQVLTRVSKKLSYVLRHDPASVGLDLDEHGWADIDQLLSCLDHSGTAISRACLDVVVAGNDKQRFAVDGDRIRASQGHSIDIDLGLDPQSPPERLYHGTAKSRLDSIVRTGLHGASRRHVHLSRDIATARTVGSRHGSPVVVDVAAAAMHRDGHAFYRSANGVWLTRVVPPGFLSRVR